MTVKRGIAYWKKWICLTLVAVFCLGSFAVGVGAESGFSVSTGESGSQRDEISFYELFPQLCSHTPNGTWVLLNTPTETEPGAYVQYCSTCKTGIALRREIPCLSFSAVSLTLTDSLAVNFKVQKSLIENNGYQNPSVQIQMNKRTWTLTDYREAEDFYVFSFQNLAPQLMNETISAKLFADLEGNTCSGAVLEYSVVQYCLNQLNRYASDEHAAFRTLLVDLLHYGAASQQYTGYRTDALATSSLSEAQLAWGTKTDRDWTSVKNAAYITRTNATVHYTGIGLALRDSVAFRLKIEETDLTGLSAQILTTSGIYQINSEDFVATDGGYWIYFDHFTAAQMSESVYITMYRGKTAVSNTMRYSVESYAVAKKDSADASLAALVSAMMRYGDSAKAYVAQTASSGSADGWTSFY